MDTEDVIDSVVVADLECSLVPAGHWVWFRFIGTIGGSPGDFGYTIRVRQR